MLEELVDILPPFAEASELMQGGTYTTIGCVVPTTLALLKNVTSFGNRVQHHGPIVAALSESLQHRFSGLLANLRIA